jgi:haloacetate dehalogenase
VFDNFDEFDVQVPGTTIHGRRGGEGPALLLLHGIPETHLMWHRVAPALTAHFTVVVTDLRGYGNSAKPPSTEDHSPYAMRVLARDQVEVMKHLGHDRFFLAGHDRGARCAYRMALDHPGMVTKLAVLDIVPTGDAYRGADMEFSLGFWVWSFLAAPYPVPEELITRSPSTIVDHMLDAWSTVPNAFPTHVRKAYVAQFSHPDTVHAICEQYRAAATLDFRHDEQDRGTKTISCPVLVLWSQSGAIADWYDPLTVWRQWAGDVRGGPIAAGHFLPEEAPDEIIRQFLHFFGQ